MEEKKLDINTIIGFTLIFGILIWMLYQNQPSAEELAADKAKQEQIDKAQINESKAVVNPKESAVRPVDSVTFAKYKDQLGAFGYAATLPSAKDEFVEIENDLVRYKISNKGGQLVQVQLKNYKAYDSIPLNLINDGNSLFNLQLATSDNRTLQTKDLFFEPTVSNNGNNQIVSMKLKVSENQYLEYRYEMKQGEYMVDFTVRSQGLGQVLNSAQPVLMDWKFTGNRFAKSVTYENRYTRLTYKHEGDKVSKLSPTGNDEEEEIEVNWLSYRQHFFSSILVSDTPFKTAKLSSENLVENEGENVKQTKTFGASIPLAYQGGELNTTMHWYFGPTDYTILKKYDEYQLTDSIPLGWGIFGWLNIWIFIPMFNFLTKYFAEGIAIVLMTIIVRLLMSPVTYKSYLSQAKMKVLRPEITEINEKHKDNAMKRQQETMALYGKAGVSPMSGCVPALLQLPIFYALFTFFPTAFELRQKSFLWADDLSSYDSIAQLPFEIPFYGSHVSLFPILASIAIFIYMMMTTGQNMQQQPGMPNMKFIMYLSPLMLSLIHI